MADQDLLPCDVVVNADSQTRPADDLWLVIGNGADLALVHSAGFDTSPAPDCTAVLRSGRSAFEPSVLERVAGRNVTLVGPTDETVQSVKAVARMCHVIDECGAATLHVAHVTCSVTELHSRNKNDVRRLRRALKRRRRPASPTALVDWIRKGWSWWPGARRDREQQRVVCYLTFYDANSARWIPQLASSLSIAPKQLQQIHTRVHAAVRSEDAAQFAAAAWRAPKEYVVRPDGVFRVRSKTNERISPSPINVDEIGVDEQGRHYCGLRFLHGSDERNLIVPRTTVSGIELLTLAERGAPVTTENVKQLARFLQHQEAEFVDEIPRTRIYTRVGWSDSYDSFVLGTRVIGAPGRAVVSADSRFLDGLRPSGSEDDYKRIVKDARSKTVAAELSWALGYVPPLLRMLGLRGLLASIWGPSGFGKSAGQALAMSPWGRPESLRLTGDVTPTALEAYLAMCRDLIVHLDDTQLTRQRDLLDMLTYQSAAGVGRARGTQTGGLRSPATWLSLTFVSGEKPLLREGVAAGYANRLLEVHAQPFEKVYAQTLHQQLDLHHGHTGPKFIEALIARYSTQHGRASLRKVFNDEIENVDASRSERAKQVALVVLADWLTRTIIFDEPDGEARDAARAMGRCVIQMVGDQAAAAPDVVAAAYDQIVAFASENVDNFDVDKENARQPYGTKRIARRFGAFVLADDGARYVAILPGPFGELAAKCRFDRDQVLHGLHERGLLMKGEKDRLGKKTKELGTDRPRAYWIKLQEDDDVVLGSEEKGAAAP